MYWRFISGLYCFEQIVRKYILNASHMHIAVPHPKFRLWSNCPPFALSVTEMSVTEMSGRKCPWPKCPRPKCPSTCDSLQHYSLYIWTIVSIRSGHLWGRDEISTLTLFKYIFIDYDVKFCPYIQELDLTGFFYQTNVFIKLTVYQVIVIWYTVLCRFIQYTTPKTCVCEQKDIYACVRE